MRKIRRHAKHFFIGGESFRKEFRRQFRLLILVTLGFTIAFTWRQTIFDTVQSLVILILKVKGSATLSILTSLFITLISVAIIYFTSYILQDKAAY